MVSKNQKHEPASLYVMSGADKIKVGIAHSVERRQRDIEVASPVPIHLEAVWKFSRRDAAWATEQLAHAALSEWHSHNEWFATIPVHAEMVIRGLLDGRLPDYERHWPTEPLPPDGGRAAAEIWSLL